MRTDGIKHQIGRSITRQRAQVLGLAAIGIVVILQAVNSFGCYKHDFTVFLISLGFIAIPMLPALVGVFTANPLRAVGASGLFAPWLALAFYTDCIRPYAGGGASMAYVGVVTCGFFTALLGALVSGFVLRLIGIEVRGAA